MESSIVICSSTERREGVYVHLLSGAFSLSRSPTYIEHNVCNILTMTALQYECNSFLYKCP